MVEYILLILLVSLCLFLLVVLIWWLIHTSRHKSDGLKYASVKYPNGDKYEGYWLNNLKHGHGVYYWHDGHVYTGNWAYDNRNGRGELLWANKKQYVGNWKDNRFYGKGILRNPDGTRIYGVWSNGVLKNGKSTPSKSSGQYLSFFLKEGQREFSQSFTITDKESHVIDKAFIMHQHEIPYFDYKIIAYDICEHFYIPLVSDKRETLLCLGSDQKLYNFLLEIRNLLKLYTDKSVRKSIFKNQNFCKFVFEEGKDIPKLRKYNDKDVCFVWKDSIDDYKDAQLTSDYQKKIIKRVQYVQDILFEFDAFKFDKDCLVIDEDKKSSLEMSAKIKSFAKQVGVIAARQAAKFAVMAAAGYFGANLALGDDGDGLDGDWSGGDLSLDYNPDVAAAVLPPSIIDMDFDFDTDMDVDMGMDADINVSNDHENINYDPYSFESDTDDYQHSGSNPSFQGNSSDSKNQKWYSEKLNHAMDMERQHRESAQKALDKGDITGFKDYMARAHAWQKDVKNYGDLLKNAKS